MVVHVQTIVRVPGALPEIVPEVVPYNAVIESIWRVIETPEVEKRVMGKEEVVPIEDPDEQEHSFSMPLSPAR